MRFQGPVVSGGNTPEDVKESKTMFRLVIAIPIFMLVVMPLLIWLLGKVPK